MGVLLVGVLILKPSNFWRDPAVAARSREHDTRTVSNTQSEPLDELAEKHDCITTSAQKYLDQVSVPSGQNTNPQWGKIKRGKDDIVRLFCLAPVAINADAIVRNESLNPLDSIISVSASELLEQLIRLYTEQIRACLASKSGERHKALQALQKAGALAEVRREDISQDVWAAEEERARRARMVMKRKLIFDDDEMTASNVAQDILLRVAHDVVPGAVAFLSDSSGKVFVATHSQVAELDAYDEYYDLLVEEFFHNVLAFFLQAGACPGQQVLRLTEKMRAVLQQRRIRK